MSLLCPLFRTTSPWLNKAFQIVVVLLDVYSYLDNVNVPMEQVQHRMEYYKFTVKAALQVLGIPTSTVTFVQESSYELNPRFVTDNWKLCTVVPQQAVRDAWDRSYNPNMLSPMLCPGLQTLAEEHLDIDFQLGGEDQVHLFPSITPLRLPQPLMDIHSVAFSNLPKGSSLRSGIKNVHI